MGQFSWRRALPSALISAAIVATLVVAITRDGYRTTDVKLHDPGVWLTRNADLGTPGLGRVNTQVRNTVDTLVRTASEVDVLQSGRSVFMKNGGLIQSVDVTRGVLIGKAVALQTTAKAAIGGDTLAAWDEDSGLHIAPLDKPLTEDALKRTKTSRGRSDGVFTVGVDGKVHALKDGVVTTYDAAGKRLRTWKPGVSTAGLVLSAAGETPIGLTSAGLLVWPSGKKDLSRYGRGVNGPAIQLPSNDAKHALVATAQSLLLINLKSGKVSDDFGTPRGRSKAVRPVRIKDGSAPACSYGAWEDPGIGMYVCDGGTAQYSPPILGELQYRVNRNRAVLNAASGSAVGVVDGRMQLIDGAWNNAFEASPDDVAEVQRDDNDAQSKAKEKKDDGRVHASPIDVGVRVGVPRVIRALDYTRSAVRVTSVSAPAQIGGSGQFVTLDPGTLKAGERLNLTYTVQGTRGADDTASAPLRVTVRALDAKDNTAPKAKKAAVEVVSGRTLSFDALAKVEDAEGDGITLRDVVANGGADKPQFQPNGVVTFKAPTGPGRLTISYDVYDDFDAKTTGTVDVTVVDPKNSAVKARDDVVFGVVGRPLIAKPLANDENPAGGSLNLFPPTPSPEVLNAVRVTTTDDQLRLVANKPGTFAIPYTALNDDDVQGRATLRAVFTKSERPQPPVAGRDDVALAPGVPVIVPVLENDSDPDGDLLVVQSIEADEALSVEVLDRRYLRVRAANELTRPIPFTYMVSDGVHPPVRGTVMAKRLPVTGNRPPIARDDAVSVRAGNATSASVLENDIDPEGGQLQLVRPAVEGGDTTSAELVCADDYSRPCPPGTAFVQGDQIRVLAPATPGTLRIAYTVTDAVGSRASAALSVRVVQGANRVPTPPTIEARADLSQRVKGIDIPIPALGADPDGDVVRLIGIPTPPQKGGVTQATSKKQANVVHYVPNLVGTDEFTYKVRDAEGLEAEGTILVGVLPAPTSNQPPVAAPDTALVLPGGTALIDVLANDSDPDGDEIELLPKGFKGSESPNVRVVDGLVRYNARSLTDGKSASVSYSIKDARGSVARGTLTITASRDVPGVPPVAVDDVAPPTAVGSRVSFDVLENDRDPDGNLARARVTPAKSGGLNARTTRGVISFVMPKRDVQLPYTVQDAQGHQATAMLTVPLSRPDEDVVLRPDSAKIPRKESVEIPVLKNDEPAGKLELLSVSTPRSGGTATLKGDKVAYTPPTGFEGGVDTFTYEARLRGGEKSQQATVTVQVADQSNHAPTFTNIPLTIAARDTQVIDLSASVVDQDAEDKITFTDATSDAPAITASLSGARLTVKAANNAKSQVERATITVKFRDSGEPNPLEGTGKVDVTVLSASGPKPVATNDAVESVTKDPDVTINVLDNDVVDSGEKNIVPDSVTKPKYGTATIVGKQIRYVLGSNVPTNGAIDTFSYKMGDDTFEDPARQSQATVTVTIIRPPGKPGTPTGTPGNKQVDLSWSAPSEDGGDHSGLTYLVTEVDGKTSNREATGTSLTVTGLTNGTQYRFKVIAKTSKGGEGAASEPSSSLKPNTKPGQPGTPSTEPSDKQIKVTWSTPPNEGTAITSYELSMTSSSSSSPTKQTVTPPSQTAGAPVTYTWTGLTNGTSYFFRVKALNEDFESTPSELSAAAVPYGKPLSVPTPSVTEGDTKLDVTWGNAQDNGAAIETYDVLVYTGSNEDSGQKKVVSASAAHTASFTGLANGTAYNVKVRATNKAGTTGGSSVTAKPYGLPGVPTGLAADGVGGDDTSLRWTWSPPASDGGSPVTSYKVFLDGSLVQNSASRDFSRNFGYSETHTVTVRAVNARGDSAPTGGVSSRTSDRPVRTASAIVEDSFLGGTWARSDPNNGTWHTSSNRPANGQYWMANGRNVTVNCTRAAASYEVKFGGSNPRTETWNWWIRMVDGNWFPTAATRSQGTNGAYPGVDGC